MNALSPPRPADASRDGWHHIGKIADGVVRRIGLQAIRFHLNRAAESSSRETLIHFREADAIRHQLGLSWGQVVDVADALAWEAA